MNYQIISDGSCDLSKELVEQNKLEIVPFYVSFDNEHYLKEGVDIEVRSFYDKMVQNTNVYPKTSMPTAEDFHKVFTKYAKEGIAVICICITTKFSGSYNSATVAKNLTLEEYPNAVITVIDSYMNTCLQGLLVLEACKMQQNGYSYEDCVIKIKELIPTGRIFFTVGNIDYLKHGGRIGKIAGVVGSALHLKPLIVLKEGEIFSQGIAFKRKLSFVKIIDNIRKHISEHNININDYQLVVGFGYDIEEAHYFKQKVEKDLNIDCVPLAQIGATIGVHTGPYPIGVGLIKKYNAI